MGDIRRFVTFIDVDEGKIDRDAGVSAPGDYLETEFCWLDTSGISLRGWRIVDSDDEIRWSRYINYLIGWAMDHADEECEGMSPACYDEWCNCEGETAVAKEYVEVVHAAKGRSSISKTGLMCSACFSDVDSDAVFCKYCGAMMDGKKEGWS